MAYVTVRGVAVVVPSPWQMTFVLALIMRLGLVLAYCEEWRSDDVIKDDVGAAFVTN